MPSRSQPPKSPAERQRDYRRRHAGGRLNVIIDPGAKFCLEQMAEERGWTMRRMVEMMIFNSLQPEHAPNPTRNLSKITSRC